MAALDPLEPSQAPNLWVAAAPAIEERTMSASPQPSRTQSPAGTAAAHWSSAAALQQSPEILDQLAAPSMVDASLLLGQSFRAGWGPHCTFVQPCTSGIILISDQHNCLHSVQEKLKSLAFSHPTR